MTPAPAALLAVAAAAVASIGGVDAAPPNGFFDHVSSCVPDVSVPCTPLDPATISAGSPHIIPCNECWKIDTNGDLDFPAGLDVRGKLVFEDDDTFANITTPHVFVQGMIDIQTTKEISPANKRVTFTLTGTDAQTLVPHESNGCGVLGHTDSDFKNCNFGKKPFVVAGGRMNVKAFPPNCPSWTKLHSTIVDGVRVLSPGEYEEMVVPPASCGADVFDHTFTDVDYTWTQGEGEYAGATCGLEGVDMLVTDRAKDFQGPTLDLTQLTPCIKADTDYLFTARMTLTKEGVATGTPTQCKETGGDCLQLTNWIMYGDESESETRPVWGDMTRHSAPNYGEPFDYAVTMQFSEDDLSGITFNALRLHNPGKDVTIHMTEARLTLPDASSYHSTCSDLVLNGDAEGNGFHPHPVTAATTSSRALVLEEGGNKFYRQVGRTNRWDSITFPVNENCVAANTQYTISARARIHSETPVAYEIELRRYRPDGTGNADDYVIADCPPQSINDGENGFVLCEAVFTLPADVEGGASYHLRYEVQKIADDSEKWVVDFDDFSVTHSGGAPTGLVLPEDVTGCWGPGSEILVTSHTLSNEHQVAVISSVEYDAGTGLSSVHLVDPVLKPTDLGGAFPQMAAEVALLSRNVEIAGEYDPASPAHGGVFLVTHTNGVNQAVEGVEFRNMGQKELNKKTAVAFRQTESLAGSTFSYNSIVLSHQWCVVLANVNDLTVEGNVGYDHLGHCFVTQDGAEWDNVFRGNLGALTKKHSKEMNYVQNMEDKDNPSTFFFRGMENYVEGNVAAGSSIEGFYVHAKNDIKDESSYQPGNPRKGIFRSFKDNVAHSSWRGFRFQDYIDDDKSKHSILENVSAYRIRNRGVFFYYSYNTGIRGGFFADCDIGIDIERSVGITPLEDIDFYGETDVNRDLVLKQNAEALNCDGGVGAGIRTMTYNRYTGWDESTVWTNLRFSNIDGMNNCNPTVPIMGRKDESRERFDMSAHMTNVSMTDASPMRMYLGDILDKNIDDVLMWDLTGTFNPDSTSTSTGPNIMVSNNDKMTGFANGPCTEYPDQHMSYCLNTCPRTVTFRVGEFTGVESWTLFVKEDSGQQRSISVDGKHYNWSENSKAYYPNHRTFQVNLPGGGMTYTAEFRDAGGNVVWPLYAQEEWDDPPPCSGHANQGDITLTIPDPAPGDCDDLVMDGDMEACSASDFGPWKRTGSTIKFEPGWGRGGTNALTHTRSDTRHGPGQWFDMRCVRDGTFTDADPTQYRQYEFRAWVKLNQNGDGTCDPNQESSGSGACPKVNFRYEYYKTPSNKDKYGFSASTMSNRAQMLRPYKPNDWNLIFGVFAFDLYRGTAIDVKSSIFWEMDNWAGTLVVDDVSIVPADATCDEIIRNGDFKTGDTLYWDTYAQEVDSKLELVEGADGSGDWALRAYDRKDSKNRGQAQHLKLGCLKEDDFYVVKLKYKIELNGVPVACVPDQTNLDIRCPDVRLRSYLRDTSTEDGVDKNGEGNINVANADFPAVAGEWNTMSGFYKATAHQHVAEELRLYFEYLQTDYDLIIDDVSFKPHPQTCDGNLVLNSDFADGTTSFWSFRDKNRGNVTMVQGAGGTGDFAPMIVDRSDSDASTLHTRLDSRCFQAGQEWEINAKFMLLNSTGGGQECDVTGGSTGNSGTRCPVVRVHGRVCDGGSNLQAVLVNEPEDGSPTWDKDSWNTFYNTFPVNAEFASCKDVYVQFADANVAWDVLIDDVSITQKTTFAPTSAPTKSPVTAAPTEDGTSSPTVSPTSSPTRTDIPCPGAGSKLTIAAGWHAFAIVGADDLCTLTRVTKDSVSGDVLEVLPLGRSYDGMDWSNAAGKVADSLLSNTEWTCYATSCEIELPALGADEEYVLTGYDHSLPAEDAVARFLEGATFGTTQGDLDGFNGNSSVANMAAWVEDQMNPVATPPTSHREYWRKRTNSRWVFPQPVAQSQLPCEPGSRWRKAALTNKDQYRNNWNHFMRVTSKNNAQRGDFYVLSVDGVERTTVPATFRFQSSAYDSYVWDSEYDYPLCDVDNGVGKRFRLRDENGSCQDILGGNPAVDWTDYTPARNVVDLSNSAVEVVDEHKHSTQEYFLVQGAIAGADCGAVGDLNVIEYTEDPVLGQLQDGTWVAFDPYVDIHTNTPQDTLPDGGGKTEFDTSGRTLCANAPRTFLNFDQCTLSTEPNTCGEVPAPPTEIVLDDENIAKIHELTGRYVYGMKGLVVKQVNANTTEVTYDVTHPCTPGLRSRWLKNASTACPNPTGLQNLTSTVLTDQILSWTEEQDNPFITDVFFPKEGTVCDPADDDVLIEIDIGGDCWTHVHPDYLSVFDLTYWTYDDTHPGNMHAAMVGHYNPIKKWMDLANSSTLTFPSTYPDEPFGHMEGNHSEHHGMRRSRRLDMGMEMEMMMGHNMSDGHSHDHPMTRWEMHKVKFTYVGRMYDVIYFRDLPNDLRLDEVAEYYNATSDVQGSGILVCGSPGEVENDPSLGAYGFDIKSNNDRDTTSDTFFMRQKSVTWTMAVLEAQDQLRQKMAWALSQILVVVPEAVAEDDNTEMFLGYYDIFVRNAFGNYRDILREISYSAMMAENLSYLQSKSHAYMREKFNQLAFADENFAREIMQLFTIGLFKLNRDGTPIYDELGKEALTYTNEDIMGFARGWTGFDYQKKRGNMEEFARSRNRMDPMKIDATWRDKFPIRGLDGGYIGDKEKLCVDLPEKMFLRKGAKYRLLGSASLPEKMYSDPDYLNEPTIQKFELIATSNLKARLCANAGANCASPTENEITLENNLSCGQPDDPECKVDTVRVVQIAPDLYYEYVRPSCVELAFYGGAKKLSRRKKTDEFTMCANPLLPSANDACCIDPFAIEDKIATMPNQYDGERVTYSTAQGRCLGGTDLCDYDEIDASIPKVKTGYHWTTDNCFIDVKVDKDGNIAIVYRMNAYTSKVMHVDDGTLNYFPVAWESGFPGENGAACPASCTTLSDGACKCSTSVQEAVVYDNVMPPSKEDALSKLHIGSMDVSSYDAGDFSSEYDAATMITAHKKNAGIDADTVFELVDDTGRTHFLRNMRSTVTLQGTSFSFRNSPHYVSLIPTETDVRDAEYETEAILDHYFYNDNTAPFLAIRFIQRFGISNPTPAFVLAVATAFRSGSFEAGGKTFGDGKYGNLQATAAAVLLHPEARSVVLDADPSHGSLREPLVKVISLMRNLNFTKNNENELVRFDHVGLENTIGQMAHMYPTVFSFFLPEYIPAGRLTPGSLVAPEAMMVDMPKQVAMLNGIFSLVKYGFEDKNGGFGENGNKIGELGYASGLDTAGLVDDLATLLTAGRLSADNRAIVVNAVDHTITNNVGFTLAEQGLELAQQLIATTAEFHSTNIVKKGGPARAVDDSSGSQSLSPYKAVVFLMLAGGCDSYQMLVPHTCAVVGNETSLHDQYVEIREDVALEKESLLLINATDSDQYCDWFGLHPQLQNLQQLYNEKDALLVANAGVLTKPTDKDNYKEDTVTNLFAHNTMQREGKRVDPYEAFPGSGVMGRVTDVLHRNNYKTSAISIDSNSIALVGKPGESPTPFIISKNGITPFNEDPTTNGTFMQEQIDALNSATTADSGFMAETWSSNLFSSLKSNEALDAALASAVTNVTFPSTKLGDSLEMVARLIQTASTREVDRDFFYVQMGGYDTHSEVLANLQNRFVELDGAIGAFSNELKAQGVWDDVVVVEVSDFARTLTPNSGKGTDHAWGGNYFMLGGGLKGGQILGKYPEHITSDAPLNVGRGRIIPTTSWDHLWNGVAEWVGVDLAQDALEVCPNGGNFNDLFTAADLFDPAGGARMRERFLRN